MKRSIATLLMLAGLASPMGLSAPAYSADYISASGAPSACANPAVLGFITQRFEHRAAHYLKSSISIAEIRHMDQSRFVPRDEQRSVEREYCKATAVTTDGHKRKLWYLIERNWGFAGLGENIEFCLSGLDPWYVYGAQCRSLR